MQDFIERVKLKLGAFFETKYNAKNDELISWLYINAKN